MALSGHECAGYQADHSDASGKLSKLVRQVADRLVVAGVTEIFQHCGEVSLRQKILGGPGCQPTPGQQHSAGGADLVSRPREQKDIAKCRFILHAASLLCRYRGR
ncbi:hypothetical protein MEA186_24992 [Mesorhizobium amorphae CCNWGS0123]|uniref:Uncharacterized protein n=1 Tax=Mesorhizobium amorphae CCNWGS0123 TaxID=1082933 RepID=G6YG90_9HYPH|nr:hypothetical protein MEA186_24992 [Mesorhizobium amorphae CCNWGS0123]